MAKLSRFEIFVFGIILAITKKAGRSHIFDKSELLGCIDDGLSDYDLRTLSAMKNLQKGGFIDFILVGDGIAADDGVVAAAGEHQNVKKGDCLRDPG